MEEEDGGEFEFTEVFEPHIKAEADVKTSDESDNKSDSEPEDTSLMHDLDCITNRQLQYLLLHATGDRSESDSPNQSGNEPDDEPDDDLNEKSDNDSDEMQENFVRINPSDYLENGHHETQYSSELVIDRVVDSPVHEPPLAGIEDGESRCCRWLYGKYGREQSLKSANPADNSAKLSEPKPFFRVI